MLITIYWTDGTITRYKFSTKEAAEKFKNKWTAKAAADPYKTIIKIK